MAYGAGVRMLPNGTLVPYGMNDLPPGSSGNVTASYANGTVISSLHIGPNPDANATGNQSQKNATTAN